MLRGMSHLRLLVAHHNNVTQITTDGIPPLQPVFVSAAVLERIELAENRISSLPDNLFLSCNALTLVTLHSNLLTALSSVLFPVNTSLLSLFVS